MSMIRPARHVYDPACGPTTSGRARKRGPIRPRRRRNAGRPGIALVSAGMNSTLGRNRRHELHAPVTCGTCRRELVLAQVEQRRGSAGGAGTAPCRLQSRPRGLAGMPTWTASMPGSFPVLCMLVVVLQRLRPRELLVGGARLASPVGRAFCPREQVRAPHLYPPTQYSSRCILRPSTARGW